MNLRSAALYLVSACFLVSIAKAADLLPLTDNLKPPYLAVWKEVKSQPDGINQYNAWLNRKSVWADVSHCGFFKAPTTWAELELPFDKNWGQWVTEGSNRRIVLGLVTLPWDGSTTLAQGAAGAYDSHFAALAQNLVANHLGNTIICMGPSSSWGGPVRATSPTDTANFAHYWQHIVKAMKAVPGTSQLQFDWVIEAGTPQYVVTNSYPGDDCVDLIGIILGEGSGDKCIYPYPPFASPSEKIYRQKVAWDLTEYPALQAVSTFAKAHGKPFSIPKWNLSADHTRSSGFDSPYFIEAMFKFIQNPDNDVYFASYFEYYHYSWLSATNNYHTVEPQSAAVFQKLFSLPSK